MNDVNNEIVKLNQPITRGEKQITDVLLREPKGGDLRGINLSDLLQMEVGTVTRVVERISTPLIDPATFNELPPTDILNLSLGVISFFADTQSTLTA